MSGTVPFKVLDESRRILAKITKVDGLASLLEQEHTIEDLEEFCRRLEKMSVHAHRSLTAGYTW